MGVFDWIKKIIKKTEEKTIASDTYRYESIPSDTYRYESYDTTIRIDESLKTQKSIEDKNSITLEKDSLKLGVAAGYISRYLIDIEDSLKRLESMMTSKDWIMINILPKLDQTISAIQQLKEIISKHEANEEKRFEIIYDSINKLRSIQPTLPEKSQNIISETIENLKRASLTPKMEEILRIVKEKGEISYLELSEKMNITIDSLRGILSKMCKITDEIERFEKEGKGWVRYKAIRIDTNRYKSIQSMSSSLSLNTTDLNSSSSTTEDKPQDPQDSQPSIISNRTL